MKIKGAYLVKRFYIPSRSEKGNYHSVELYSDNSLECECIAGMLGKECYHKKKVKEFLNQLKKNES